MPVDVQQLKQRATAVLGGFSTGQKVVSVLAIVGLFVGATMFTSWAGRPTYAPLFTNLEPADAAAITQKLAATKTPYELADGGSTVMVPRSQLYQLRLDMSGEGLPTSGSGGYELLDKQGITASQFSQRVGYQRALQGELAKTIGAIEGVSAASVHLAIPEQDVFRDDSRKPTASVLLKTVPGKTIAPNKVQAVVNLVSSSVEGMAPEDVTVADAKGTVLSSGAEGGGDLAGADARTAQTRRFEQALSTSVQDMLSSVVGAGKAVVRVRAELDFDQRQTTSERFDQERAQSLSETSSKETYAGTGAPTNVGVLGVEGAPATTPGGTTNYEKEQAQRNFAVDRVTEQVKAAPGKVERLSVAVVVDEKGSAVPVEALQRMVSAAAGLNPERGDTIAVDRVAFDSSAVDEARKELEAAEDSAKRASQISLARTVGTAVVLAVVLLIVLRSTKKALAPARVPVALQGSALQLGSAAAGDLALGSGQVQALPAAASPTGSAQHVVPELEERAVVQAEVGRLIERQPEEVAQLLRSWLADRSS